MNKDTDKTKSTRVALGSAASGAFDTDIYGGGDRFSGYVQEIPEEEEEEEDVVMTSAKSSVPTDEEAAPSSPKPKKTS